MITKEIRDVLIIIDVLLWTGGDVEECSILTGVTTKDAVRKYNNRRR